MTRLRRYGVQTRMCEYVISDLKSGGWHHFSAGNVIDLMDQFVVAVDFDVLVDV